MTEKLYQIYAVFLAAILILSACQSTDLPPATPTPLAPENQPTSANTAALTVGLPADPTTTPVSLLPQQQLDGLQVHFWHPWSGEMSKQVDLLVDQFNQTNEWGIHVIVRKAGSSMALSREVDEIDSAENLPQVVAAPSEQLLTWFERGERVLKLDALINDPYWGLTEQQRAEFGLVFWLQDQAQDQQIGIPAQRTTRVMVYNQSWARELGFDAPPQTAEDFRTQACAAGLAVQSDSDAGNDGMGGWIVDTDGLTIYSWLRAVETAEILQGDPPEFIFDQPQVEQSLTFLRQMVDDGCAWIARNPTPQEYFSRHQALFYSTDLMDLPIQVSQQALSGSQDEWIVLPFPGDPRPTLVVSGISYGILTSTPASQLASWAFVRWMSSADNQARLLAAGGGLPVSISAASLADGAQRHIPQWAVTVSWIPFAQPAPQASGWRVARFVLEDAAWQAMQSNVPPEQIEIILAELDATIAEVLEREQ